MVATDSTDSLLARVRHAIEHRSPVLIEGGGSKRFYGYPITGETDRLDMAAHQGVIDYSPDELVIRVRAGSRLSDINRLLRDNGQMLPFEPPGFTADTTIGGVIASGLSGPRRPWAGSARDFVLGVRLITGRGEVLEFGGQVMKNVAGYDVSRLVTGSLGTLGVILDVSLKVLPAPELEVTRVIEIKRQAFQSCLQSLQKDIPLSAASHHGDYLNLRLSGSEAAVKAARKITGGEETGNDGWDQLNKLALFAGINNLWRISVAPASKLFLDEAMVIDWGGGIRWLADPGYDPRELLTGEDGHATLMRYDAEGLASGVDIFQPLPEPLLGIHKRLKQQFDPAGIFNPGRMYRAI